MEHTSRNKRINQLCSIFDERVSRVGVGMARAEFAERLAEAEAENERLKESIKPISHWLNKAVAPNERRIYYRCPICRNTWHEKGLFSRENHFRDCWVPGFKQKAADDGEGE